MIILLLLFVFVVQNFQCRRVSAYTSIPELAYYLKGTIQVRDYTGYALSGVYVQMKSHSDSQIIGRGITDGDGLVNINGYINNHKDMIDIIASTTFGNFKAIETLDISNIKLDSFIIIFRRELMFSLKDQQNFQLSEIQIHSFGFLSQQRKLPLANVSIEILIGKIGEKEDKISVTAQTDENGLKTVYFLLPKGKDFDDIDYNGQKDGYWGSDSSQWYWEQFQNKDISSSIPQIPKFSKSNDYRESIYIYLDVAIIKFIFKAIVQNQYGQLISDALMIINIEDVQSNENGQSKKQMRSNPSGLIWIEMLYQPLQKICIKESIIAKGYINQNLQFEQTFNFSQRVEQYIHDFGLITLYKSNDKVQIIITGRIITQFHCKGLLKWKGLQKVKIQVKIVKLEQKIDVLINKQSIINSQYASPDDFIKTQLNKNLFTSAQWKNIISAYFSDVKKTEKTKKKKNFTEARQKARQIGKKQKQKSKQKNETIEPRDKKKEDQIKDQSRKKKNPKDKNKNKDKRKNKNFSYIYTDEDGYFFLRKTSTRGSGFEFQFSKNHYLNQQILISVQELNHQPDDSYFGYLQKIKMKRMKSAKNAKCPSTDQVDED